jgi:hypothetical protein
MIASSSTQTYTGGHSIEYSFSVSNFLLCLPDLAALAAFKPALLASLFNTRFCPFGHVFTDFGQKSVYLHTSLPHGNFNFGQTALGLGFFVLSSTYLHPGLAGGQIGIGQPGSPLSSSSPLSSPSSSTQTYTGGHSRDGNLLILEYSFSVSNFLLCLPDLAALAAFKPALLASLFNTRFCPFGHIVTDFGHVGISGFGIQMYTGGHRRMSSDNSLRLRLPVL